MWDRRMPVVKESSVIRRFRALGIEPPEDISFHFQVLVLKLEEEKIRHYGINKRELLREEDMSRWIIYLRKYCEDLGIKVERIIPMRSVLSKEVRLNILDKLLDIALREEYLDMVEEDALTYATEPEINNINEDLGPLLLRLNELLKKIGFPVLGGKPPIKEIRSAILLLLSLKLESIGRNLASADKGNDVYIPLEDVPCGIMSKDPSVLKAARILRSLHSKELCKLQAEIVWLSERFQQLTANPLTNPNAT